MTDDVVRCGPCGADAAWRAEGFWQCPVCMTRVDPAAGHGAPADSSANLIGWAEPPAPEAPTGGRAGDPTVQAAQEQAHATVTVGPIEASTATPTPGT